MEPRRRGAKIYLAATVTAQLCALARYTILARFLGPEELGLVAMLTLTSQFFQSVTDNGSDRFLIQDKDGDKPVVQGLVQALFIGRGGLQALCLMLFAGPIAAYFKTPALQPALTVLALAPLIFGFLHLDFRRDQRQADFRSEAIVTLAAEVLSLAATGAAAYITHDFTAILYGLIVRSIAFVVITHLLAKRPYRVGFSKEHMQRLAHFSWPLVLNGLLLFIGSQGDRVVVANELGIGQLGYYTAVLMLVFYPASTIMRYVGAMHLPLIAAARDDQARRDVAADALGSQILLLGTAMAAGFALVAPIAVVLLYGSKFAQPPLIIAMIGIFQATRVLRQWPTTVALGMAHSEIVLANNIVRMSGLACAFLAVRYFGGVISITAGFIVGELLALATAILLVNRASGRRLLHDFDRVALFILASMLIVGWTTVADHREAVRIIILACGSMLALGWLVKRERATLQQAVAASMGMFRKT